jgi:hypothetical protein
MFFPSVFISLKLKKQNTIITNANKVKEPKLIIISKSLEYIVIKKRKRLIKKENKSDTLNILKFINLYMSLIFVKNKKYLQTHINKKAPNIV